MKDVDTILKALNTFDGYDAMLYDANTGNMVRFQDVVDFITWQKAEIERLTKEKKTAWQKFKQKVDENIELSMLLDKRAGEKAELQKQVDERENEIDRLEKVVHDQAEQYWDCKEQAVKDTADEIYDFVKEHYSSVEDIFGERLKEFVKHYGVEVE